MKDLTPVSPPVDQPDWDVVLGEMQAMFRAPDFSVAADFLHQVARLAELRDHHPDLDLRYPGWVNIRLFTHATLGLTRRDANLATEISALARSAGLTAVPETVARVEVAIDALDIAAILPFWRAVLAYVDQPSKAPAQPPVALVDPLRVGPPVWFQQMDEPRPQRNRLHVDVSVPAAQAEARIAGALAAGGRILSDRAARAFWVLADPEGNEACICTWQDRGL